MLWQLIATVYVIRLLDCLSFLQYMYIFIGVQASAVGVEVLLQAPTAAANVSMTYSEWGMQYHQPSTVI